MKTRVFYYAVVAVLTVPFLAINSHAGSWFSHDSSVKSTSVNIMYNAKLSEGKTLEAGNYRLEIPLKSKAPQLRFYQAGKLVATVPAKVKMENRKPPATEVDFSRKGGVEYLTEIRPDGMKRAYVIASSQGMKSGA